MINLHASDLRTFVPSQDFALSKDFYSALGCELEWSDDNLALFNLAGSRFYLQRYYVKEWAENSTLHISVQDAVNCFADITELVESGRFPSVRIAPPKQEPENFTCPWNFGLHSPQHQSFFLSFLALRSLRS